MNRILTARHWITVTLTALFVTMSYELQAAFPALAAFPSLALAGIAFVLGTELATRLGSFLFTFKSIRRRVVGSSWIEGYWLIETDTCEDDQNPLRRLGMLFLEYKVSRGALKAVTTRFDEKEKEYVVTSQVAHAQTDDEENIRYLNYFKLTSADRGESFGLAFGEFFRNQDFSAGPCIMDGKITLEGDGVIRKQIAKRVPDARVTELHRQYGDRWIKELLMSDGVLAFPASGDGSE